MTQGIYQIVNLINNKIYIGQSKNIERRWAIHKRVNSNPLNESYDYPLYRAFRKYGLDNFNFKILEICNIKELNTKESFYINLFNSFIPNGYNQTLGEIRPIKLIPAKINNIILDLSNSLNNKEISVKYNISTRMVRSINSGECWRQDDIEYPIRKHKYPFRNCKICNKKIKNSLIYCSKECSDIGSRKVIRPIREDLKNLIRSTSFVEIGFQFNVSDTTIKKWCDLYKLPRLKKDIKIIPESEWELI